MKLEDPFAAPDGLDALVPNTTRRRIGGRIAAIAVAGALLTGGIGAVILAASVNAADPTSSATPSAAATPSASNAPSASTAPSQAIGGCPNGGGFGGPHETVTDTSVAAKAIGISEADLTAALAKGQTIADVATANNVDVQVVIDALTADAESELAAQVSSGALTQAQADQEKTGITQRVTDQVNGAFGGPGMGGHGMRGPGLGTPTTPGATTTP